MESISLDRVQQLVRGKLGLIIGPSQSLPPSVYTNTVEELANSYGVSASSLVEIGDAIVRDGKDTVDGMRQRFEELSKAWVPSAQLGHLAKVNWSAVLSASPDIFMSQRMQVESDSRASRRDPSRVDDLTQPLEPRSVPVFMLLGSILRHDCVVNTTSYLLRKAQWRLVIPVFAHRLAGNPVICVGMAESWPVLLDILSEFAAGRSSAPSSLLLLRDDPLVNNPYISDLLKGRTRLAVVDATIGELVAAVESVQAGVPPANTIEPSAETTVGYDRLLDFVDIVTTVNLHTTPRLTSEETSALRELLFSPSIARWDPYAYGLDFRRSLTTELLHDIQKAAESADVDDHAFVVLGSAASGKTTLVKRLAFDLASKGYLTLWQSALFIPDPRNRIKELFRTISKHRLHHDKPIIYIIDDALASQAISSGEVIEAARAVGIRLLAVVGLHETDSVFQDYEDQLSRFSYSTQSHLQDALDEDEAAALPRYLVTLGICTSLEEATIQCSVLSDKYTRDTLALMYWLLPQARAAITSSVRNEFTRLGDYAGFRKMVIGDTEHSSQRLRDAYEMVAVSSKYDVPLPVEVLVAALEIDYTPWLKTIHADGPVWGILYSEPTDDNSERYRTRNDVVTRVLVEYINGGTSRRDGEVAILRKLFRASEGQESPVYREFVVSVLVPYSKLNGLPYLDGKMLYQEAIAALPHPDQTLMHHMGLWINKHGGRCLEAAAVLEQSLTTPVYPYADRGEAPEHIYTSLAVAKLDATDNGELTWEDGKNQAIEHLQRARAKSFYNPNTIQVEARVAARIIQRAGDTAIVDSMEVGNRALCDLDRTLQILTSPIDHSTRSSQSQQYLLSAQQEVLASLVAIGDVTTTADDAWERYKTQAGFLLAARGLLRNAREQNRDKLYRRVDDYCQAVRKTVEDEGLQLLPEIAEVQLNALYEGYIQRYVITPGHSHIDWERIEQLAREAIAFADSSRNPMVRFILAVALAHREKWSEAEQHFAGLRSSPLPPYVIWQGRILLLQERGGARTVQGTIRRVGEETFVYVEELHRDVKCERRSQWRREGEVEHVHIQFAFGGATAIHTVT